MEIFDWIYVLSMVTIACVIFQIGIRNIFKIKSKLKEDKYKMTASPEDYVDLSPRPVLEFDPNPMTDNNISQESKSKTWKLKRKVTI